MVKSILIISHTPIDHDNRVIKTAHSFVENNYKTCFVGFAKKHSPLTEKVIAHYVDPKYDIWRKVKKRMLFTLEYDILRKEAIKKFETEKFDFIWANDLPCLYPGYRLSDYFESNLIYDSHEIYIETLNQFFPQTTGLKRILHRLNLSLMMIIGKFYECKYGEKASLIITVNNSLKAYFQDTYGWSNIHILKNAPIKTDVIPSKKGIRKELGLDVSAKVILYQGNLNPGRGLFPLIKSFKYLPKRFHLLVLGSGVLEEQLRTFSQELKVEDRIHFYGYVGPRELMSYTQCANLGICFLEPINKSKELALPNKIFEYLMCRVPILGSKSPEILGLLEQFEIGSTSVLNPDKIAENIQKLCENFDLKDHEVKRFLDAHNWESEFSNLLSEIEKRSN